MIRSAAWKLALSYLAIIMVLSLVFSALLYRVSSTELNRDLRRQSLYAIGLVPYERGQFELYRENQMTAGQERLRDNLILFNLAVLLFGGAASYWLARRTLNPIEDALEAQTRFTADASHELRTPLTAMQTEIEVALRHPKLAESGARELLGSNLEEIAKLKGLAEGLLRLAQPQAAKVTLKPTSSAKTATAAIERLKLAAKARSITVHNQVTDHTVLADDASLTELMVILLDNAIKYSPAKTTVTVSSHLRSGHVYLSVADQGPGIAKADLPHIFDRFYRGDPSRSKGRSDGYGLGLSIARKIAEANHGAIEVTSAVGQGSTFTIKLSTAKSV